MCQRVIGSLIVYVCVAHTWTESDERQDVSAIYLSEETSGSCGGQSEPVLLEAMSLAARRQQVTFGPTR